MTQNPHNEGVNDGAVLWGVVLGLLIGGLTALFIAPKSDKTIGQRIKRLSQPRHDKLETTAVDPLADSIATGKAAARRRLEELGLDK